MFGIGGVLPLNGRALWRKLRMYGDVSSCKKASRSLGKLTFIQVNKVPLYAAFAVFKSCNSRVSIELVTTGCIGNKSDYAALASTLLRIEARACLRNKRLYSLCMVV